MSRRLPVLHSYALRIFHFLFGAAFHAVGLHLVMPEREITRMSKMVVSRRIYRKPSEMSLKVLLPRMVVLWVRGKNATKITVIKLMIAVI